MEYEDEPIPGLPGRLPPGETIIWQGTPDWRGVARGVFHTRLVAVWFLFVASMAFVAGGTGLIGALTTLCVALLGLAVLGVLARAQAKSTIYTLTNKRVVLRFGVALPKCVNVPLSLVGTADAKPAGTGLVDVSLTPTVRFPLAYLQMWPHVRPWKFGSPQPMLRAVPESMVPLLADALAKADPARAAASPDAAPAPAMVGAAA
ncbi:photosynthetic complex putative assembly protein PuhB [Sandarakinorhabdus oryzae]|uniref:photosynthetic complex putative assembly protein PuhB n=1 Tax=Sandarakinorhabdus oryzae TaxID=2675220 RepID=UPI001F22D19A|nr:photosynthetic complex putative assembly protein PuhB [Sandarakinorhabdus oryzae]